MLSLQALVQCSQIPCTTLHKHSSCDYNEDAPSSQTCLRIGKLHGVCSILHKYNPSQNASTLHSCLSSNRSLSPPQLDRHLGMVSTPYFRFQGQESHIPLPAYSMSPVGTLSSSMPASSNAFVVLTAIGMQVWPTANIATASCRRERKCMLRNCIVYVRNVSNGQFNKQK